MYCYFSLCLFNSRVQNDNRCAGLLNEPHPADSVVRDDNIGTIIVSVGFNNVS